MVVRMTELLPHFREVRRRPKQYLKGPSRDRNDVRCIAGACRDAESSRHDVNEAPNHHR